MVWFNKKKEADAHFIADKRERLFFHDIINHTHGLILYFNQKQSTKSSISAEDVGMLEKEIRTLQSLIKDHFHFKHKNLMSTYEWVPFSVAEMALNGLIQTYLSEKGIKTYLHREGKIAYERSLEERESATVYFPAFYRIMNNLIKNIAEAKSSEVHFHFNYFENGFLIETKNRINSTEAQKEMADNLSRIILETKYEEENTTPENSGEGLGLESIHHLALEHGGRFDFEIVNDYWINKITLPVPLVKKESKKAA
jgi:hypothetical protein